MRKLIVVLLLFVVVDHTRAAELEPINIEFNPVVKRRDLPPPPPPLVDPHHTEFYVEIPLPEVTLSPADILTVNVHFTDDKMLQVNTPLFGDCGFHFTLSRVDDPLIIDTFNGNDGGWRLEFLNFYNWPNQYARGWPNVWHTPNPTYIFSSTVFSKDIENGSRFGDFKIMLGMPTWVSFGPSGDPIMIETTTFTYNSIKLYAIGSRWHPIPPLQVVPEPATFLLFALGGLILRKRK